MRTLTILMMTTRYRKLLDMQRFCQVPLVPNTHKESTKERQEVGRREQEWEEVLLKNSSGQSEVPSEGSTLQNWMPESTADSEQDQTEVS